jgi:squalene-hopene/tetraprenyl-beta-curcumene cyclase
MKVGIRGTIALLACVVAGAIVACSRAPKDSIPKVSTSWDPKTAAAYLDYREGWWTQWTGSARDHGTFCVSCHTALPYALARPALRDALGEQGSTVNERQLIENVVKRVRLGKEAGPYYSDRGYDHKTGQSRGTEAVLNALILASHDAPSGQLSEDTRTAFTQMWASQQSTGAWLWLQFDQEPWEANDSDFYGATLAAMAVGIAPENYASKPEIQDNLRRLRDYLNRESAKQSIVNRIFLLWASTKLPGLVSPAQAAVIIHEALSKQQADGGWRLASITWKWSGWTPKSLINMWLREDGTPMDGKSDGLATSLITLTLQEAGVSRDNPQLKRGLTWLTSNQNTAEGFWPASSVNKRRHVSSDTGRFMSDAATAFAVLALTENQRAVNPVAAGLNQAGSSSTTSSSPKSVSTN